MVRRFPASRRTHAVLRKRASGFSLIEVLIAITLLALGLLGVARLQASTIGYNHGAYLRSQATLQIYDMADRMRSNVPGVVAGSYNALTGIPADPGCLSTGCTPAQMATLDAFEWNTNNQSLLPTGTGTVTGTGSNSVFTVTVTWTEIADDTAVAGSASSSFRL
jgi:type IV pilus assembly protein PilV